MIPILNYDAQQKAVIEPFRNEGFQFPNKMLLAFIPTEILGTFLAQSHAIELAKFYNFSNTVTVYQVEIDGQKIGICQAIVGAPAATQVLEFLIAYGSQTVLAVGSCGTLAGLAENQLLVPTKALRDEGTSFHYLPSSQWVTLPADFTKSVYQTVINSGVSVKFVKTWTTDAIFRETPKLLQQYQKMGVEVVEMECAALAACAEFRHAQFAQILFTADSLANIDQWDAR